MKEFLQKIRSVFKTPSQVRIKDLEGTNDYLQKVLTANMAYTDRLVNVLTDKVTLIDKKLAIIERLVKTIEDTEEEEK